MFLNWFSLNLCLYPHLRGIPFQCQSGELDSGTDGFVNYASYPSLMELQSGLAGSTRNLSLIFGKAGQPVW